MTQLQAYFGDTGVLRKAFCNVSVWTCRKKRAMALGEVKVAFAIMAAVAVAFAAYQGASVFAPLVLALFIVGITWPLQRWLQSRMPKLIALAITLIVIVAVGVAFASLVAWGFGRVGHALMSDAARYQALYDNLVTWLDSHGISVAGLWAEHFNVRWLLNKAQYVAGRINSTLAFWLITLIYVILGLLEVDDIRRKVETLRNREAARVILDGSAATAVKFRKYLLVRTQMSVLTGLFVGLFALATGLQFAAEWGVIAFALNYIPFIGPFIATLFPTLVAMTQFDTWQAVVGIFICLTIIQFVIGCYVEPRLSGSVLSISPFVVLFTIFFWTLLWGLFGSFIGVPIVIAILTFCEQHSASRWLSGLLGTPPQTVKIMR